MKRRIASALGSIALAALLAPVMTAMADPPPHARNQRPDHGAWHQDRAGHWDRSGQHHGWRDDGGRHFHRYPRPGSIVTRLPPHHRVVHYHGHPYYYSSGAWYRRHGPRYVVVTPPLGLTVSFRPDIQATLYFGGVPYYRAGPAYFVWHPQARAYVVTEAPYAGW